MNIFKNHNKKVHWLSYLFWNMFWVVVLRGRFGKKIKTKKNNDFLWLFVDHRDRKRIKGLFWFYHDPSLAVNLLDETISIIPEIPYINQKILIKPNYEDSLLHIETGPGDLIQLLYTKFVNLCLLAKKCLKRSSKVP